LVILVRLALLAVLSYGAAHELPEPFYVHAFHDFDIFRLCARSPAIKDGLSIRELAKTLDIDAFDIASERILLECFDVVCQRTSLSAWIVQRRVLKSEYTLVCHLEKVKQLCDLANPLSVCPNDRGILKPPENVCSDESGVRNL